MRANDREPLARRGLHAESPFNASRHLWLQVTHSVYAEHFRQFFSRFLSASRDLRPPAAEYGIRVEAKNELEWFPSLQAPSEFGAEATSVLRRSGAFDTAWSGLNSESEKSREHGKRRGQSGGANMESRVSQQGAAVGLRQAPKANVRQIHNLDVVRNHTKWADLPPKKTENARC